MNFKFYICPKCGNVIIQTGDAEVTCCGSVLQAQEAKPAAGKHQLKVESSDGGFHATFEHEQTKAHYLNFVAYVSEAGISLVRLHPEQAQEARLPLGRGGRFYFGCNVHGLFVQD